MKPFGRFATTPIAAGLTAVNDGLAVTTTVASVVPNATARATIGHSTGTRGAEFSFIGEAQLLAAIGVIQQGHSLDAMVGAQTGAVGWRLDNGTIYGGNATLYSGMPVVAKGDIVGLRIRFADAMIDFMREGTLVHSVALPASGEWFFAVSLASVVAGEILAVVNAGQWLPASQAAAAGWAVPAALAPTLRLADHDYLSAPTDAEPNARYEGVVESSDFATVAGIHFWPWGTQPPSGGSAARLRVVDADGVLDAVATSDVAGSPVRVRMTSASQGVDDATAVARFALDAVENESEIGRVLTLSNPHVDLDAPLHRMVFPPTMGALAWRPVPVVIGAVASVPVHPVNSDGSVGWVSDRRVYVQAVYDRGDLLEPGTWQLDSAGQQILFQSPPLGPVTCDCSSIGPAMQPATLAQAMTDVMARIGKSAWSLADAQAIDAATGYAGVGFYAGIGDTATARQAMAKVLASYGAWWHEDELGVLRLARIVDPDLVPPGQLAFDINEDELQEASLMVPDAAENLSRRMAYRPNAYVHSGSDLVTDLVDVPPARRVELTREWRGEVYAAAYLPSRYAHADTNPPFVSCLYSAADAQAEINRTMRLYITPRYRHGWSIEDPQIQPRPGAVGKIRGPKYGAGGKNVMVINVTRNPVSGRAAMVLWG